MREKEVNIQSGEVTLSGTLCVPDTTGKFPVVLMIHGSGPLDRNENMSAQQLNIFNTIAHALADQGIASLRYDKRGCGTSSGDFMSSGHYDLVQDAVRCLDYLAQEEIISSNNLFILGHSEGCIIAPQVSQLRPGVSGLILLCPFIEKFESILLRQAEQLAKEIDSLRGISSYFYKLLFMLMGNPSSTQRQLIRKVQDSNLPIVRIGLTKQPAKWLRELLELDIESIFSSTHTPMLLIGGEIDLQCNPQELFRIAEVAQSEVETLIIKKMTHILRKDQKPPTLLGYKNLLDQPLENSVITKTAQWILNSQQNKH